MKLLLDFLPIVVFFAAFKLADVYVATGAAIVATLVQLAWLRLSGHRIEVMNWLSLVLIVVFGGLTLGLHDETFIKWKPTILYWAFAAVLAGAAWWRGRNLVQTLMGAQLQLPDPVWARLNRIWIGFFVAMGALNLVVARLYDTDTWVNYKLWGSLGLTLAFVLLQGLYIGRHLHPAGADGGEDRQ